MELLSIPNNIFYSCEILHADGRCFQHLFTGPAKIARSGAITFMLEYFLSDDARKDTFCLVSAHTLKTGEKITVTSSDLLYSAHEGLQLELDLWQEQGIQCDVVLFNYRQPQYVTLLLAGANFELLKSQDHVLGIAEDWSVTFGRKRTKMNVAA